MDEYVTFEFIDKMTMMQIASGKNWFKHFALISPEMNFSHEWMNQ